MTTPNQSQAAFNKAAHLIRQQLSFPVFFETLENKYGIKAASQQERESLLRIGSKLLAEQQKSAALKAHSQANFLEKLAADLTGDEINDDFDASERAEKMANDNNFLEAVLAIEQHARVAQGQ